MKRFVVVLLAGVVWCLCGCSGSADPPAQAVPTASVATSAPTPTGPVEPVMPAAARERSRAGAIAFARYYWAVANFAMGSLDTSRLASLAAPTCTQCTGAVTWIRQVDAAGGRIVGGLTAITAIRADVLGANRGRWLVELRTRETRSRVVDAGGMNRSYPPGEATDLMVLDWAKGGWEVTSWRSHS